MARNYIQGIYTPKNPEKYAGNLTNIVYRSSWEKKAFIWCDTNPSVLKWVSEEIIIPYISPVDNRQHRYFVDLMIKVRNKNGEIKNYLVEIKPEVQTKPPKDRKRKTKNYLDEHVTYSVNKSKWEAARAWCKSKNLEFVILTEKHLF
jgi:hypothetical protein